MRDTRQILGYPDFPKTLKKPSFAHFRKDPIRFGSVRFLFFPVPSGSGSSGSGSFRFRFLPVPVPSFPFFHFFHLFHFSFFEILGEDGVPTTPTMKHPGYSTSREVSLFCLSRRNCGMNRFSEFLPHDSPGQLFSKAPRLREY